MVGDLSSITALRLKKLFLHDCEQLRNISGLAEMSTLEVLTVPAHVDNIDSLRKLASLKWLAYSIKGPPTYLPITTATQFWQEQEKLGWLRSLPKLGNTKLHKQDDGTWYVNLDRTQIEDLSNLRGAPISILSLSDTLVADLEPLRGMAIKHLYLFNTKVTDLSPLKGMPLEILNVVSTKVSDITPLKDMPIISLRLHDCTYLADLSPLVNNKTLKELTLPTKAKNIDFLRRLPKLERLSFNDDASNGFRPDKTVREFWQEYDSKK